MKKRTGPPTSTGRVPYGTKRHLVEPAQVYPGDLKYKVGTDRQVTIGSNTRLLTAKGDVVFAQQLLGKNKQELEAIGPFLMFDKYNRLCSSEITAAVLSNETQGYRVKTRLGSDVVVGSDTALIVDDPKGLVPRDISNIQSSDQILQNKSLHKLPTYSFTFFDLIDSPEYPIYLIPNPEVVQEIKQKLRLKYGSIKEGFTQLQIPYRGFRENGRLARRDLVTLYNDISFPDITNPHFSAKIQKIGIGGTKATVDYIPINKDLMYIMGLVASDSWVGDKRYETRSNVEFYNTEPGLIQKFIDITQQFFPGRHVGIYHPSEDSLKTATTASTSNYALVRMINNLRIKGKETSDEDAYTPLLKMPLENIAGFLRGLFDGDGSVDVGKQDITIAIFSPERVKNAQLLLKKLNIDSKIKYSEEYVTPPGGTKPKLSEKYELQVLGKKDLMKFIKRIGTSHPKKMKRFEQLKQKLETQKELSSKYNLAPIKATNLFRSVRQRLSIPQSKIGNKNTIASIETQGQRTSIYNMAKIMKKLKEFGADDSIPEYRELRELISFDYNFDLIESTSTEKTDTLITILSNNRPIIDNGLVLDMKKQ